MTYCVVNGWTWAASGVYHTLLQMLSFDYQLLLCRLATRVIW